MTQFNFTSEIQHADAFYNLNLSVDDKDIVFLAKGQITPANLEIQKRINTFCEYAANKNIFTLNRFFLDKEISNDFDPLFYAYQRGLLNYSGEDLVFKSRCKKGAIACVCSGVTVDELAKVKNQDKFNMNSLVKATKAGTGCGSCLADLKKILATFDQLPLLSANSYVRLWDSMEIKGEFVCRCKKVPALEIAELLEKIGTQKGINLYKNLQAQYGIGLGCDLCENTIKEFLS